MFGADVTQDEIDAACGQEDPSLACRQVMEWTGNDFLAQVVDWIVAKPLKIALILVVAWFVNRLARRFIKNLSESIANPGAQRTLSRIRQKTPVALLSTTPHSLRSEARAKTITLVLRSIATAVIATIASVMVLAELGINVGPLIAGAGIVGVALGFGSQSLVRDFLSGMFMLIEDQFGVGDVIDAGEAVGVVEAVSLRTTRLRDVEGTVWHIPNGEIHRVGNKSQQWARALLDISVAYGTDLHLAQRVIKEVADGMYGEEDWRRHLLEEPEVWGVEMLGADGIAIRLVLKTQPGEQWKVARELRLRLKDAFDAAGIEIPFPQRTLWVRRAEGSSRDEVDPLALDGP